MLAYDSFDFGVVNDWFYGRAVALICKLISDFFEMSFRILNQAYCLFGAKKLSINL